MSEFWENKFQEIGLMWSFEPADSAVFTSKLFAEKGFRNILIPGVGYGRNAKPFIDSGFNVTGIEISETAIRLARDNSFKFPIHRGSVNQMPFDDIQYDGIYCYALIHLLNQNERRQFLKNSFNQLCDGGIMIFVAVSKGYQKLFGQGKQISKDRFKIDNGLDVFFYDQESIKKDFGKFGLLEFREIDEPVKHLPSEDPMKFWMVICRKQTVN